MKRIPRVYLGFGIFLFVSGFSLNRTEEELGFLESPDSVICSQGTPVRLRCSLRGSGETPEIRWERGGSELIADTKQVLVPLGNKEWLSISELSIPSVHRTDSGRYRCAVTLGGKEILSEEAELETEGLPYFTLEPGDAVVRQNLPFNLSCAAVGTPTVTSLLWLRDGVHLTQPEDPDSSSPSTLSVTGINRTRNFRCEAHNSKGVATSRTATVRVLPESPENVTITLRAARAVGVCWQPGDTGNTALTSCTVQASVWERNETRAVYTRDVSVPPFSHELRGLSPHTRYSVRLACSTQVGVSTWSQPITAETLQGEPESAPRDLNFSYNGSDLIFSWEPPPDPINGDLLGYRVAYQQLDSPQVIVDTGLSQSLVLTVILPVTNLSVQVLAYTAAGDGPWTEAVPVSLADAGTPDRRVFSWYWWYVVMAVTVAMVCAVCFIVMVTQLRKKAIRYGEAFEPMIERRGDLVVHYRVKKSYSRRTNEATLSSLGISEDLREKLRDVMVDQRCLALGKTLGEGEFGSVMEGQLNQNQFILKVAVKTMKISICTRSEMEDFLCEAVCMKEFDHPNVMRLLGVCLQSNESEAFPSPVVILPYMKHGDLHSFLLSSRLGAPPRYLPVQTLVKFMADIGRGMEYLSNKNFIHRDLAARNCMLNENMTVCVADFGLSKKIYNGDYYRQGRIAKMPVKWIAIESLADRVYTTKSDVWSFGVTMWEIASRGQTPYPGVENSEIYDYLRQGKRLKQPPDCPDPVYELMSYCWRLEPQERPSFAVIGWQLGKLEADLVAAEEEDMLYVNMEEAGRGAGATGGLSPALGPPQPPRGGCSELTKANLLIAADVHPRPPGQRYVLCPPHDRPGPGAPLEPPEEQCGCESD